MKRLGWASKTETWGMSHRRDFGFCGLRGVTSSVEKPVILTKYGKLEMKGYKLFARYYVRQMRG
jgi:hypothetical protein